MEVVDVVLVAGLLFRHCCFIHVVLAVLWLLRLLGDLGCSAGAIDRGASSWWFRPRWGGAFAADFMCVSMASAQSTNAHMASCTSWSAFQDVYMCMHYTYSPANYLQTQKHGNE